MLKFSKQDMSKFVPWNPIDLKGIEYHPIDEEGKNGFSYESNNGTVQKFYFDNTYQSKNHRDRDTSNRTVAPSDKKQGTPQFINQHPSVSPSLETAIEALNRNETSVHFLVDTDGKIYQFIPLDKAAFAIGRSYFDDYQNFNNENISIMYINEGGNGSITEKQTEAGIALTGFLKQKYDIQDTHILGYNESIAFRLQNKSLFADFPWEEFFKAGIGLRYDPEGYKISNNDIPSDRDAWMCNQLATFGYRCTLDNLSTIEAIFQNRYGHKATSLECVVANLNSQKEDLLKLKEENKSMLRTALV
jgi:N-acetyl-anhydromuramyl-L-alanine amidase AmpD